MTFLEAYILHGPDVELIAQLLGIKPHEADRLINEAMDRAHFEKLEWNELNTAKLRDLATGARA